MNERRWNKNCARHSTTTLSFLTKTPTWTGKSSWWRMPRSEWVWQQQSIRLLQVELVKRERAAHSILLVNYSSMGDSNFGRHFDVAALFLASTAKAILSISLSTTTAQMAHEFSDVLYINCTESCTQHRRQIDKPKFEVCSLEAKGLNAFL